MRNKNNLNPEFISFISGITKFIDETDEKRANELKKTGANTTHAAGTPKNPEDFNETE